jgi:hypothetical protein
LCTGSIERLSGNKLASSGMNDSVGSLYNIGKHVIYKKQRNTVSWLNRILNTNTQSNDVPSPSTGFFDIEGQPVALSLEQRDVRAARELIRASAVRTTAAFGIPAHWLSYEVVTISDDEKAYFQLQVSLRIWDEQLWSQSGAYEQQALKRIREDDVNVGRAVRAVLWRILPDAGCPHDELAGAAAWKPDAVKTRGAAYDRLRSELSAPAIGMGTTLPSLVTSLEASATLPAPHQASGFGDTLPVPDVTGFSSTLSMNPAETPQKGNL